MAPPFVYDQDNLDDTVPGLAAQNSIPNPVIKLFPMHWVAHRGATYYDPSCGITASDAEDYTDNAIEFFGKDTDAFRKPRYSPQDEVFVRFSDQ